MKILMYLFIAIKKVIEDVYLPYLPKKGHPWVYLSLEILPQNIDVNVHPTKHEVRFCHEDAIIEKMRNAINEKLVVANDSRTFYIQAKLPPTDFSLEALKDILPEDADPKKLYPKDFVRTRSDDQKLDKFNFTLNKSSVETDETDKNNSKEKENEISISKNKEMNIDQAKEIEINISKNVEIISNVNMEVDEAKDTEGNPSKNIENISSINVSLDKTKDQSKINEDSSLDMKKKKHELQNEEIEENNDENIDGNLEENKSVPQFKSYSVNDIQIETKLLSVLTLRKEVEDDYHDGLRHVLANLVFVGCIDECTALIQSGSKLYISDTQKLA